jgi:hypothetical protein
MAWKPELNHRRLTFQVWAAMKQRCYNPKAQQYKNYGARGIQVCDRWLNSYMAFEQDMGLKPEGLSLDRIDNNGNYEPGNCRWATAKQQRRNQRNNRSLTFQGETKTIADWADQLGLSRVTVNGRLQRGFSCEEALLPTSATRGSNQYVKQKSIRAERKAKK